MLEVPAGLQWWRTQPGGAAWLAALPRIVEVALERWSLRRRLDVLVDELGLDRERMRLWGIAHALAWGVEDDGESFDGAHVHAARLLAEA